MQFLAVLLTLLLFAPAAFCFSIDKVQIVPSVITAETDVSVLITVFSAAAPRGNPPTQLIKDQGNLLIIIYPIEGVVGLEGSVDKLVSLGTLPAAGTKLTIVLAPLPGAVGAGDIYSTNLNVVPKPGSLPATNQDGLSIDKVQVLPDVITPATDVTVVVSGSAPGGTNRYQPTQVVRTEDKIAILIYPDAGVTGTTGHFDEPVSLGRLNTAVTQLTVALVPSISSTNTDGRIYATNLNMVPNVLLGLKMTSGIPFLIIDAPTNQPGLIESSTAINSTNWTLLASYGTNPRVFGDLAGTNSPVRFYRVRSPGGTKLSPDDPAILFGKKIMLYFPGGSEFMNFTSLSSVTDELPSLGPGIYMYSVNTQSHTGTCHIVWSNGDVNDLTFTFSSNSTGYGTWSGNEHYDGADHMLSGTFSIFPL